MSKAAIADVSESPRHFIASDNLRVPPIAYRISGAVVASGSTRTRVFGAIKNGELKARKDGKATIIEHEELMRWVRSLPVVQRG